MPGESLEISEDIKDKPSNKQQGVKYVTDTDYVSSDIDAQSIAAMSVQNWLLARTKSQQMNLIFPNPYSLKVLDPNGDIDEDVSQDMRSMCESKGVNLWQKMQFTYSDVFEGGAMIANPVWKYENNVYTLVELNHLPWQSFACSAATNFKVYSEILTGIGVNAEGIIEFWQYDLDYTSKQLANVVMIKNPMSQGVAGTPLCIPIIPLINASKFALNAQMQKVNRVGAPTPFLKVTDAKPKSPTNGNESDEEYANRILGNYSKDVVMALRGNMDLVDGFLQDSGSALETIDYLNKQIIEYWSPSSMIQSDGNTMGGNTASELGLLMRYVSSVHEWIENPYEELLQIYLDANGYEGYRVVIEIPEPEVDNTELDLKKAVIVEANPGAYYVNELRALTGHDEIEDMEGKFLSEFAPAPTPAFQSFENSEARPTITEAEEGSEKEQRGIWEEAFKKAAKLMEGAIE